MTGNTAIPLYRERGATDVINVAFRFLRAHFAPLAKGLLLLAGPFLIVANVVSLLVSGDAVAAAGAGYWGLVVIQFVGTVVGGVIAMAVSICALRIVHDEGASALSTGRLWAAVRTHGLPLFGRQIQIGVIFGLGGIVVAGGIGGVAGGMALFAGGQNMSVLGVVALVVLSVLFLALVFYVAPALMLLLPGQVDAERPISISRCLSLMRGRWGQTLGVWLLATVITTVLFSVGWIPSVAVDVLSAVWGDVAGTVGLVLAGGVAGVANALAPTVTYTAMTLQYYNLIEQKEQVSLNEEVGRIEEETMIATTSPPIVGPAPEGTADDATEEGDSTSDTDPDDDRRWQPDEWHE